MNILGISYNFHDAAACLLRDGAVVAAAEEERFSRIKHDAGFPAQAIAYCLGEGRIAAKDLACVAFYEKPARKLERVLQVGKEHMPQSAAQVASQFAHLVDHGLLVRQAIDRKLGFGGPVYFAQHHVSHAASAFFASPFHEAAVLVVDGVGEWATCTEFFGSGARLDRRREIRYPDSLGLLYASLTAYLGFRVNDDEYKVMGLASYGKPRFRREFEKLITIFDDGSFALNPHFFSYMYDATSMYSSALVELLGPARGAGERIEERHRDIAASLQAVTEEAMVALARSCLAATGSRNLCLAGGVAYNCVANSQVVERGGFEDVFVQPAAGDNGAALGAALWAHHVVHGAARIPRSFQATLGPRYGEEEIHRCLRDHGLSFLVLDEEELCRRTAQLIQQDLIVGWFQGRMEFGPRALGSRSILANPCSPQMRDVLNARVKFREDFRPFAPAVPEERAAEYFELDRPSPFMLLAPRVRADQAGRIPSVTHVDGTARVQTVSREQNPLFHRLLGCFGELTGVPVLINTSFNIRGEPIVCSPQDAVRCFLGTDIDFLAIGAFLVSKEPYDGAR